MRCALNKLVRIACILMVTMLAAGASEGRYQEGIQFLNFNDYSKGHEILKPLAEAGDARAQTQIGHLYKSGLGVERNLDTARHWYVKAAEQGDVRAQFQLGLMYFDGDGVAKDYRRAWRWFQKAAQQGDAVAQYQLGAMYELAQGVRQDYTKAAYWYQQAANQGLPEAQFMLSDLYYKGQGVPRDIVLAHMWVNLAVSTTRPLDKDYNDMVVLRDKLERLMSEKQIQTAQHKRESWQPVQ